MVKSDFMEFYNKTVKKLGIEFVSSNTEFQFFDNPDSLYEEYLNQKTIMRLMYNKKEGINRDYLDRHKVCACMTVAIIKIHSISTRIETDDNYTLSKWSRANEQLAFMSAWELFLGFIRKERAQSNISVKLPDTYHNDSFLDTFTRSLFISNHMNVLSTPLIANIFFLLERYCELESSL